MASMNGAESTSKVQSGGALTNAEAAALIEIILANTSTQPVKVSVPDSPKSLTDLFPVAVLAGV